MKNLILFLAGTLIFFSSCKEDMASVDPDPRNAFIGKVLPCNDYLSAVIDRDDRGENYAAFTLFQDKMIFGGEDRIILKNSLNEDPFKVIEERNMDIKDFLVFENKLYAYGSGGIFEIDVNFEMRRISDLICRRMNVFEDQILLLATPQISYEGDNRSNNILKLDLQTDSLEFYTNQLDTNLTRSLYDFVINGDEIWANEGGRGEIGIFKFKRNELVKFFSAENDSGLEQVEYPSNDHLLVHDGTIYYYINNGLTDYFLKNETGEQFEFLKMYEPISEQSTLEDIFIIGSPNAVKVIRDSIYIASTNRGIFKFGLSNDDFEINYVRDTLLTQKHTTNFYIDEFDNRHFFINNYDEVTQINCF